MPSAWFQGHCWLGWDFLSRGEMPALAKPRLERGTLAEVIEAAMYLMLKRLVDATVGLEQPGQL